MSTRLSRVRILLGASMFATLALLLAGLGVNGHAASAAALAASRQLAAATGTASPSVSPGAPQPTPTTASPVNLVKADGQCANQPKPGSDAYIEFCTPSFDGHVEGPWGTHVTITGGNFKTPVASIYLAVAHGPGVLSQVGCLLPNGGCLAFDNATKTTDVGSLLKQAELTQFTLTFTWTFPAASAAAGNDYTLIAEEQGDKTVPSPANFTLLSTTGPCISAAPSGTPPDCTTASGPAKPLQVLEGQTIQVAGSGWLPGDKVQKIDVLLQCQSACQASPNKIAQLTTSGADQPTTGGALGPTAVTLPAKVAGTYLLIAENGDKSEVFGDGPSQAITLNIVAHPCIALGGNCMWSGTDAPQSMAKATSATIMLENWKAGGKVNVYLVAGAQTGQGCKPAAALGKQQTLTPSTSVNVGQSFTLPSSLQVGKTYTLCATGQSTLGGDAVTAAMPVRVVKAIAHPLFSMLSLLALLLGLVSVAAYALTTRQRVATPQPVARR